MPCRNTLFALGNRDEYATCPPTLSIRFVHSEENDAVELCVLLLACSLYEVGHGGWLSYLRPYMAAVLVGSTLLNPDTRLGRLLKSRVLAYLASISFALYMFHMGLTPTWLGSGDFTAKYLKRPLLLLVLFPIAPSLDARLRTSVHRDEQALMRRRAEPDPATIAGTRGAA